MKRGLVVTIRGVYLRPIPRAARALFASDAALLQVFVNPTVRACEVTISAAEAVAPNATQHRQRFVEAWFTEDLMEWTQKGRGRPA